ncbi:MAG: hypothetical protein MJE68_26645 [Proteobacteria bacterium]|nr:hypothetical protein [Pseudomonadota bacterium]
MLTVVKAKQVLDYGTIFSGDKNQLRHLSAFQAKDQAVLNQCVREDKAYRFMKNIRGSPP